MYKMPSGPSAYFDVDDTIIEWNRPVDGESDLVEIECRDIRAIYKVNKHNIDYLHKLASRGHAIILWSAGRSDWAEAVCYALKLNNVVDACLSKPTYYVDDRPCTEWMGKHKFYTITGEYQG